MRVFIPVFPGQGARQTSSAHSQPENRGPPSSRTIQEPSRRRSMACEQHLGGDALPGLASHGVLDHASGRRLSRLSINSFHVLQHLGRVVDVLHS